MRHSSVLLVVAVLVLGACSSEPDATPTPAGSDASPTADASTTAETTAPTPAGDGGTVTASPTAPTTDDRVPLEEATVQWQVVGGDFAGPLQVLVDPRDGQVLVVEQAGRISALDGSGAVLDLTDRVTAGGEQGLLGVAFHPAGEWLYVHYSGDGGQTVLSRFPVGEGALDPSAETVLLTVPQPAANHNGGSLLFAPDGALVLGLGDGGAAGDRFGNGQDPGTLLGALLRFDVDAGTGDLQPAAGNPFRDGAGDPRVWAYGLRNPWRVAFDQQRLYIADVGQDAVEEVSVVLREAVAGSNFGWPILEGTQCYREDGCDPDGTVLPVAELRHADGACSIIGGVVVPDGHPTGLGGAYLYSDLCDTRLHGLRVDGGSTTTAVVDGAQLPASPLGFGTGPDGRVWVGTADGQVLQLAPA